MTLGVVSGSGIGIPAVIYRRREPSNPALVTKSPMRVVSGKWEAGHLLETS